METTRTTDKLTPVLDSRRQLGFVYTPFKIQLMWSTHCHDCIIINDKYTRTSTYYSSSYIDYNIGIFMENYDVHKPTIYLKLISESRVTDFTYYVKSRSILLFENQKKSKHGTYRTSQLINYLYYNNMNICSLLIFFFFAAEHF